MFELMADYNYKIYSISRVQTSPNVKSNSHCEHSNMQDGSDSHD